MHSAQHLDFSDAKHGAHALDVESEGIVQHVEVIVLVRHEGEGRADVPQLRIVLLRDLRVEGNGVLKAGDVPRISICYGTDCGGQLDVVLLGEIPDVHDIFCGDDWRLRRPLLHRKSLAARGVIAEMEAVDFEDGVLEVARGPFEAVVHERACIVVDDQPRCLGHESHHHVENNDWRLGSIEHFHIQNDTMRAMHQNHTCTAHRLVSTPWYTSFPGVHLNAAGLTI